MKLPGRDLSWLAAVRLPGREQPRSLELLEAPADRSPSVSRRPGACLLFDGTLYDRAALSELVGDLPREPSDADLVGEAYARWGEDMVGRLRGIFALVVVDDARDVVLCARDPLGIRPLFSAEVDRTLLLSPSIETLLEHPGVSRAINRASLVDRLTRIWPALDETCFAHVRRVPPGHILRIRGAERSMHRYWNPVPGDGPISWIPDGEAEQRFEALLGQAVAAPITGRLQKLFGVTRLKIDPELTGVTNIPQAWVTAEQQLSREVTVTYIFNLNRAQQQIVRLQWDFSKDFSVLAVRDENGIFGVDFLWRKRFK